MISDKSYRVPKKDFENILEIYCDFYFGARQFFPSYYDGKMNPVNYTKEVKITIQNVTNPYWTPCSMYH